VSVWIPFHWSFY